MFGAAVVMAGLACMTGCSGFFPPLNGNGSGSGSGTGTTAGDYVYVATSYSTTATATSPVYTVSGFSVGTNSLTTISGAAETLIAQPQALVVTPNNSYLYIAASGTIFGYTIGSGGALTPILNSTGGQALANANAVSLVVSPDGNWLLGLDSLNTVVTVDEFSIGTTGLLGGATSSQYALKSGATIVASNLAISPKGDYVAASVGTGGVVVFGFATGAGTLTPEFEQPAASASSADQAAVFDATSATLYIAVGGTNAGVYPFTIGNSGTLTGVAGAPFPLGTGSTTAGPVSILIDKSGKYLYVANRTASSISGFGIGTGGVLTAIAGSPYTAGTTVDALAFDKSGDYILAGAFNGGPDVEMFSFDTITPGRLDVATTGATTEPAGVVAIAVTH